MRKNNLTGKRYGRLLVIEEVPSVRGKTGKSHAAWKCLCECGNTVVVKAEQLGRRTNSCGCIAREFSSNLNRTHGQTGTRLFTIWIDIKQRCNNPNQRSYKDYGARGIKICEEWENDFTAFKEWACANGYSDLLTIERKDVNGNYCSENCTWIPRKQQAINRRSSRFYSFNGETHCLTEWTEILGMSFGVLRARLDRGWEVDKAFSTPTRKCKKHIPDEFLTDVLVAHEMLAEG